MATVTRYVNLASTAGGDGTTNATTGANRAYASLVEWEAAEQTDLVSAGDTHVVECSGDGQDVGQLSIAGWTTGASNTITVTVASGSRHNGTSRQVSGAGYQIAADVTTGVFRPQTDYVSAEFLDVYASGTTSTEAIRVPSALTSGDNQITFTGCIFSTAKTTGSSAYLVNLRGADANVTFRNCIGYGVIRSMDGRYCGAVEVSHCTFWRHDDQLGLMLDADATVTNTYVGKASGSAEDFWTSGTAPSGSNNASSDTSAATDYTSSLTSKAGADQFVSVTRGSEDFTLKSGSDLEGAGTPLGAVTDIIGTARDGTTPDIGAFEFVAAGSGFQAAWARGSNILIGGGISC